MAKEESVVKSFRTSEAQFLEANDIFRKEGFSLSEVIRLLFDATIREGRVPRGLSTKNIEDKSDNAKIRENYVDDILDMVLPPDGDSGKTAEERLLQCIFGEPEDARHMSNAALREWGNKWGLPDNLAISTLADLHDCGFFKDDPWFGAYDYKIDEAHLSETDAVLIKFRENIKDNLEQIKRQMEIKAVKTLMEYDLPNDKKEVE